MSTVSQDTIRIVGRTFGANCRTQTFQFDEITSYDQLHEFEEIKFELVSDVSTNVRSKLRENLRSNTDSLNSLRTYASIRIEPRTIEQMGVYFNKEKKRNVEEYQEYFTPYLTEVYPNGVLKNIVLLSEFKRNYSYRSFEASKRTGTYLKNKASINATQRNKFKRAELLESNWESHKDLFESEYKGITKGKEVYFLHMRAAANLWDSVEAKLKSIGIDCIILDADNITLAVKIYGPNKGYYPMWDKDQIDEAGKITISGNKLAMFTMDANTYKSYFDKEPPTAENIEMYKTCDHTNGPSMFKILKDGSKKPTYDKWESIKNQCNPPSPPPPPAPAPAPANGGKRRKTRSKKRTQRKTRRHL